jgi:hypothetical protein
MSHDDWDFEVNEVSLGVYRARATDRSGRKIELTGTDPTKLRAKLRKAAEEIDQSVAQKGQK